MPTTSPILPKLDAPLPPEKLSQTLEIVLSELKTEGSISLREFEAMMRGRGFALFILLLTIPFVQPIPLPMLSIPFGIAISILGFRIACGQTPWLPGLILDREISSSLLVKVVRGGIKGAKFLERFIRPRMAFLGQWPGMQNLIGIAIAIGGLMLCLPLPIPFSNTIPGWSIFLLTVGLIERDGLMVLLGYMVSLGAMAFLALIALLGVEGFERLISGV